MQQAMPMSQQQQLIPSQQQQQQIVTGGQNVNQTSPLLAQQLAGRPTVPGQHPSGVMQGQQPGAISGAMMQQQRPQLTLQMPTRPQLQPGQQMLPQGAPSGSAVAPSIATQGGPSTAKFEGPRVSSEDLEGLDSAVHNELGDLGMGDGDFLDMGEDFNILEFTDALDDLDDLPSEDPKTVPTTSSTPSTSSTTSNLSATSTSSTTPSPVAGVAATNAAMLSSTSAASSSTTASLPPGSTTTAISISGTNISRGPNIVTSSAATGGMMPAGHLVTQQPPPYTASAGSVNVPIRGALPTGTISSNMPPGTPTAIIRGPPPPYPGPGLAPNATTLGAGGATNIQTPKVSKF